MNTVPVAGFVALPNISRAELLTKADEKAVDLIFPKDLTLTSDVFQSWQNDSAAVMSSIMQGFKGVKGTRWWHGVTDEQMEELKKLLIPYCKDNSKRKTLSLQFEYPSKLHMLDILQVQEVGKVGSGHRLLWGVAGSGKTIILIERAKKIACDNPNARILITCFNKSLAGYLHLIFSKHKNIEAMHFHEVSRKYWGKSPISEYEKLLEHVKNHPVADELKFDTILIDEAQDFDPCWFSILLELIKDKENGDFLIVGDGMQSLYKTSKISWKSIGIQAQGRIKYLRKNYRNSTEIANVASLFSPQSNEREDECVCSVELNPAYSDRQAGIKPLVIEIASYDDLIKEITQTVNSMTQGYLFNVDLPRPLEPKEICVVYPTKNLNDSTGRKVFDDLKGQLQLIAPVVDINTYYNDYDTHRESLTLATVHSAKGLQYKAVIVFAADSFDKRPTLNGKEAKSGGAFADPERLFYVALTRAEDILVITGLNNSGFIERLKTQQTSEYVEFV